MGIIDDIEAAARKADDLAKRKRDAGLSVARHRAAGRAEGLMEAARMLREQPKTEAPIADDYPGPDGETGAAERWEALPWENRMSLLGGLAEEAAQHRRDATGAEGCQSVDTPPVMQERYAALATTWETALAALMRADTVSSKDKSPDEVSAERAKYAAPADDRVAILRFMLAEEVKFRRAAEKHESEDARARCAAKASAIGTLAAYIERGDYLNGDVE